LNYFCTLQYLLFEKHLAAPPKSIFYLKYFLNFFYNNGKQYIKDSCDFYRCGMELSQEPQNNIFCHWLTGIQFPTDLSKDPVLF